MVTPGSIVDGRRAGTALVTFGALGLVLLGACLLAVLVAFVPVANEAATLEQQRAAAMGLVGPAADALETTATSAENAGVSLSQSVAAARDAATVTGQLADALAGLGAFSPSFADTALRSRTLSDDLSRTADALDRDQGDTRTAAAQLRALADQLRRLEGDLGPAEAPPATALDGIALPLATALVGLTLLWLAGLALGSIWLGRRLRKTHLRERQGSERGGQRGSQRSEGVAGSTARETRRDQGGEELRPDSAQPAAAGRDPEAGRDDVDHTSSDDSRS
jgi:hypothetical protein